METTVATLQLGADSFQVQKRIWYINAGVASVLADPQQGIAWARFGSCCSKFDTTRFDGEFVKASSFPTEDACSALTQRVRDQLARGSSPDIPLGVTQWLLPSAQYEQVEAILRRLEVSEDLATALQELGLAGETIDITPKGSATPSRLKLFHPLYGYGEGKGAKHGMCRPNPIPTGSKCNACGNAPIVEVGGCNDIPDDIKAFASVLMNAKEDGADMCKLPSINSALVNLYWKNAGAGSLLGEHYDSSHTFARPVYTLRLLSPGLLTFVTGGFQGRSPYLRTDHEKGKGFPIYFNIPLPRGCLTEMTDFAANVLQHCVRRVCERPTASLVLRHIHESLLGDIWVRNNRIGRSLVGGDANGETYDAMQE